MPRKVILTCAVCGDAEFNRKHPGFPITPAQIAEAAAEAADAGASAVHLHVRDPVTGAGSQDPDLFLDMATRVRDRGVSAVMNVTCGVGANYIPDREDEGRAGPGSRILPAEERVRHIAMIRPEMCSIDVTTQNQQDGETEFVYLNTPATLRKMAREFQRLGVKPEIECFAPGDVLLANKMLEENLFDAPPLYQFVTGNRWGLPSTPETLIYMRGLLPAGALWSAFGIGRMQLPMVAQSTLLGGNVRVGLEDNLYLRRGVFASNGQLVTAARTIIETMGFEIATPDEARAMLGLPARG